MDFQDEELKELLNIFRAESEEIIGRMNDSLLNLEKSPSNKDLIALLFRDAHSLKGAARMIGFECTQNLAHKIEDILGLAKENQLKLSSEIADVMYKSVDLISKIVSQSVDSGVENSNLEEVENQISMLKNIKNNKTDVTETETQNNTQFDINTVNSLMVVTLKNIIKLNEQSENEVIMEIVDTTQKLINFFQDNYEIKEELENINFKLNFILKCNSELLPEETDEIQRQFDKTITGITNFCKMNGFDVINYYEKAFEDNKDILFNISDVFTDINEKVQNLSKSTANTTDIINNLNKIRENYKDEKWISIADKIIDILELIKSANLLLENTQAETLKNDILYCKACINNEETEQDLALLEQQLDIIKQLLIIQMPQTNIELTSLNKLESKKEVIVKKVKDFSKLLNSGEIKTLHVDSSKLDLMMAQIGELISTKIKTTKQLNELSNLEKDLEDCQKEFSKILLHVKSFDKKNTQNASNIISKQLINLFVQQNKTLSEIINKFDKIHRSNIEDDIKMRALIDDFNTMIKNIRILPLATVFHFFGRMVRDIAKERGKEVELTITGSETSADKKIIEEIKNPLIHIIRNAIDHGIEPPEQRIKSGKNPVGHLQINAKHVDNKIIIEVIDDGQGFNVQKIKDKALQKGFLSQEELDSMSDDEIINIVFLPGFTTGEEVTSISGRGVGMDVVKTKIAQLNGNVKVLSEFNKGTKIQIELPVTMATMSVFLIQVSRQTFAIPMSVINSVVCKKEDELLNNNERTSFLYNGKNIPVYSLANILNLPSNDYEKNSFKTILTVNINDKIIGLIADKLLGEQEILHKKLSPPIYRLKYISGITTLATGETCLILNTSDIIKSLTLKISNINKNVIVDKKALINYKKILVVDDSLTTRTLVHTILTKEGFTVETANNPLEALNKLKQTRYDIILSDIEMPEMTGLEFLEQLKTNELFADIPVIMMSSLSDNATKHQAKLLGAESYIIKGEFNKDNLIKTITNILIKYLD